MEHVVSLLVVDSSLHSSLQPNPREQMNSSTEHHALTDMFVSRLIFALYPLIMFLDFNHPQIVSILKLCAHEGNNVM